MIYPFHMRAVGIAVGLLLILAHWFALVNAGSVRSMLRAFPRSVFAGRALLTAAAIWSYGLIATIDLGEFSPWRQTVQFAIIAAYVLTVFFVQEFLAVRALGMLCLLAAEPLLEASFLRPESSRLLLTLLAYAWATLGMFWVGMPYLLRDQIDWVLKTEMRWRGSIFSGIAYGVAVLGCAVLWWT